MSGRASGGTGTVSTLPVRVTPQAPPKPNSFFFSSINLMYSDMAFSFVMPLLASHASYFAFLLSSSGASAGASPVVACLKKAYV
eukprot:CAMPEP_0183483612 /NCGR_PEP_ID=MMETSP0370-20130417/178501_1 /TAXON_ID=268820 /ORGANISM="Peridinium aciculiferum, Strain PAER-2" /LENGTH=83 /DNA_ID=CAMNT_0025676885 /DNA_START=433 /DNA_END=684 /DNA_ORIENTATION=-